MTLKLVKSGVERVCQMCDEKFNDLSRTAPRTYCYTCRPSKRVRPADSVEREPERVITGKPFTLAHFERWIDECELTLDSEEDFVLEPFQKEIVRDMFRRPREFWAIIPEGNAKTTLFGSIALYAGDHAPSPWIPIGAASREQAEIMFGQAAGFVERSRELKRRFRVHDGYRKIKCLRTGGRGIKVYAAAVETGDGVIPFPIAFLDELHRHPDLRLYRLWKGKLRKRGAMIAGISTGGEPGSEFEEMREAIRNAAERRTRKGSHLRAVGKSIIYHEWMVPSADLARDLRVVKSANPLASISVDDLDEKLNSPTLDFGEDWLRLTCNIPARSSQVAVPEATWDAQETDERIPAGVPVAVGADFGWIDDTTAIVPLWSRDERFRLFGAPEILTPPGGGVMLDVADVHAAFRRINDRNPIDMVVLDKTRAQDVAQWVADEFSCTVVDRSQSNEFQALDYDNWMAGLRERTLWHTGDREFRRHVLNAVSRETSGGRTRFDRPAHSRAAKKQRQRVIDALAAAGMVLSAVVAEPEPAEVMVSWV